MAWVVVRSVDRRLARRPPPLVDTPRLGFGVHPALLR
jgi:hypothetical protein